MPGPLAYMRAPGHPPMMCLGMHEDSIGERQFPQGHCFTGDMAWYRTTT